MPITFSPFYTSSFSPLNKPNLKFQGQNSTNTSAASGTSLLDASLSRRSFLGALGLAASAGVLAPSNVQAAPSQPPTKPVNEEVLPSEQTLAKDYNTLSEEPFSQKALETLLAFSFADGMTGLAREKDSFLTLVTSPITNARGFSRGEAFKHSWNNFTGKVQEETAPAPHANIAINLATNAYFMTGALGTPAQKHARNEMLGTLFATTLLSEKGMLAKGIDLNPAALKRITEDKDGNDRALTDPEGLIGDALFQLCTVSVLNEPILYAFGNSHLAVQMRDNISRAVKEGLFGPGRLNTSSLEALEESLGPPLQKELLSRLRVGGNVRVPEGQTANPEVNVRVYAYLDKLQAQYEKGLEKEFPSGVEDRQTKIDHYKKAMLEADFNPQGAPADVRALKQKILGGRLDTRSMRERLDQDVATEMLHDGVMGIMATAVNSAQTWWGDLGPLLGSMMKHGPVNGPTIAIANLPYSYLDGTLQAVLTAQRFGVPRNKVLTRENEASYQFSFTWNNFRQIMHFRNLLTSALDKTGLSKLGNNLIPEKGQEVLKNALGPISKDKDPALEYALWEALKVGNKNLGKAAFDAVRIATDRAGNGAAINQDNVKAQFDRIVADMRTSKADDARGFASKTRELFSDDSDLDANTKAMLKEIEQQVLADAPQAQEAGEALGDEVKAKMTKFAQNSKAMAADFQKWEKERGLNPEEVKIKDFIEFLNTSGKGKKKWYEGLMYDALDQKVSPDFAMLAYFVLLQGTSLTGLVPTINRTVYDANWFKRLPLTTRELISVQLHRTIASLADNWTDNQLANDNHSLMYIQESYKNNLAPFSKKYFKDENALWKAIFDEKDPSYFTTERYRQAISKGAMVINILETDPKFTQTFRNNARIKELKSGLKGYVSDLNKFYWRGAELAQACSVGGGGETVAGNAPNVPLAIAYGLSFNRSMLDVPRYAGTYLFRTAQMYGNGAFLAPLIAQQPANLGLPGFFTPNNYMGELQRQDLQKLKKYGEIKQTMYDLAA